MTVRVFVEGTSDVPTMREVFTRGAALVQGNDFQIYPHRGRGSLPADFEAPPSDRDSSLLGQLPSKLRAFGKSDPNSPVVVLVDADNTPWRNLRNDLANMLATISSRPATVLFRIAVEEMESWLIADTNAVLSAYPNANINHLQQYAPDTVIGAWEALAIALGMNPSHCTGADKEDWAREISPFLEFETPNSPTFNAFLRGVEGTINFNITN